MLFFRSKLLLVLSLMGGRSFSQEIADSTIAVYFNSAAYTLLQEEQQKLDSFFRKNPGATLLGIAGHTDTVGGAKYNMELSFKRSKYVGRRLKKYFPHADYKLRYFGETRPASQEDNALNRRVEITVRLLALTVDSPANKKENLVKRISLDNLYFEPDKAILENFSLDYLNSIIPVLKSYGNARFEIRGHVNYETIQPDSGYLDIMNKLSQDRAKLIYEMLIERGIPANQMSYKGMGNTEMVYPHPINEVEKRKNMRVEILVFRHS